MAQTWQDLLFAHWRVPTDQLRRVVPAELPVDTFDGTGVDRRRSLRAPGTAPASDPAGALAVRIP